jgi:DNA-binding NarL/FixJ family response regulator
MTRARLVIAEDHPETRDLLVAVVSPGHDVVAAVADGQAACEAADRLAPDLVLLDISMPVMGGMTAAKRMKKRDHGPKVIFVTGHADQDYVTEAFRLGAEGYVLKDRLDTELVPAIEEVLAGGKFRSAGLA